jgi:hypothetical protein
VGRVRRDCLFPGCDRKRDARGLCSGHRAQQALGRELKPLRDRAVPRGSSCVEEDCEERGFGLGRCYDHYRTRVNEARRAPGVPARTWPWKHPPTAAGCSTCEGSQDLLEMGEPLVAVAARLGYQLASLRGHLKKWRPDLLDPK